MKYNFLGNTGLEVSELCLGTMTWGYQNNQQHADGQIERSLEAGINFIDTAEMYAVPPSAETYGKTEEILGSWIGRNYDKRNKIIVATKIAGAGLSWVRNGSSISADSLEQAIDGSLRRLKTDYIDLYQLHWPNYNNFHWGKQWPFSIEHSADVQQSIDTMLGIVSKLSEMIDSGKIRHYGLSNESPWGLHSYIHLAKDNNLPLPVSVQNEFSLLMLKDCHYLLESCIKENIAYLPWSPLAGGALSGKYNNNQMPQGSRWSIKAFQSFRNISGTIAAVSEYTALAKQMQMTPAQLALAFCLHTPGVTSSIFGATQMEQIEDNLSSVNVQWDAALQQKVLAIIKRHPQPF